jgi:multidrug transporter EmrE-like cation transporter
MQFWNVLFLILGICMFETFAISNIKQYHLTHHWFQIPCIIVGYSVVCFLLYHSFAYEGMAIVNVLWSALSILFTTIVGTMYFKETITVYDFIGLSFILIGILFVRGLGH